MTDAKISFHIADSILTKDFTYKSEILMKLDVSSFALCAGNCKSARLLSTVLQGREPVIDGRGCIFSFIPVVIVQGIITVLAGLIKPVMTHEAISALSLVGSVLIATLGINMVWDKHIMVSNLFPSVVVAVIWAFAAGI